MHIYPSCWGKIVTYSRNVKYTRINTRCLRHFSWIQYREVSNLIILSPLTAIQVAIWKENAGITFSLRWGESQAQQEGFPTYSAESALPGRMQTILMFQLTVVTTGQLARISTWFACKLSTYILQGLRNMLILYYWNYLSFPPGDRWWSWSWPYLISY